MADQAQMRWTPAAITSFRRSLGMTQERLASLIGTTLGTVNKWERGHHAPTRLAQQRLDEIAGGGADGVVGGNGPTD